MLVGPGRSLGAVEAQASAQVEDSVAHRDGIDCGAVVAVAAAAFGCI